MPDRLTVKLAAGKSAGLRPFSLDVNVPGHGVLTASGFLVRALWTVRLHAWKRAPGEKPRDPPGGGTKQGAPRAWKKILARKPVEERTGTTLDFTFRGRRAV